MNDEWSMPLDAPFYPRPPARYRNVRFHLLFFTAATNAVQQFLPDPLTASPEGACVAAGLDVPYCSNYGAFQEAFLLLKCGFRGQTGYYCSHVFHNGPSGIAAGREIYGTPKIFSDVSVRCLERSICTEAPMGGIPVLRLSTITEAAASPGGIPALAPSWRLKLIPRADGKGAEVKQLIDAAPAMRDQEVHYCASGHGIVRFDASPFVDLSPLSPASLGDAFYLETSYTEQFAEIVYDYLKTG
jgi:acetoacetate decarboxylase